MSRINVAPGTRKSAIATESRRIYNCGMSKPKAGAALERRFEKLLGGHGTTARLARAMDQNQSHLHRIWAGRRPVPEYLLVVAEFLETTHPDQWPERWQA
jgi:hypothetical protein